MTIQPTPPLFISKKALLFFKNKIACRISESALTITDFDFFFKERKP